LRLLISLLLFFFTLSYAVTEEDIYKLSLERASDVKLSEQDIKMVEAQIKEVMSNMYPHLSINGIYTRYDPNYITGFSLKNQYRASVNLNQTIFDKAVFESIKIAKLNKKLQRLILKQVKQEVVYTALNLYQEALYRKKVFQIKQKTLKYWQKQFEFVKESYRAGLKNRFEYLRTKSQLENAKVEVELSKSEYQKSVIRLKRFLFLKEDLKIQEELLPKPQPEVSINQVAKNAELAVIKENITIKEKEATFYTASLYPKLKFKASYEFYNTRDFPSLDEVVRKGYVLSLSLDWNIYDGSNANSKAIQSKITSTKEKIKYKDRLNQLKREFEETLLDLTIIKKQLKVSQENIQAMKEALKLSTERFKYKVASLVELLEAQKNYEEAVLQKAQLIYRYNTAVLKLKKLTGELVK